MTTDEPPSTRVPPAVADGAAGSELTGLPAMPVVPTGPVRWWTAGATLTLAALLCLGAYAGQGVLVVAAAAGVLATAWGWAHLLDLPSPRGTTSLVAVGGLLGVAAVGVTRDEPLLDWLALALAVSVVGEFVHQLARRDGRPRMVESVSGSVAGVVVLSSLAAVVALPRSPVEADGVVVWAVPVAVALALQALDLPGRVTVAIGLLVAALLGGVLGGLLPEPTVTSAGIAAAVSTVVSLMLNRLLAVLPAAGSAPGWLALAVAPMAGSGMVAYVLLRLLVG